MAKQPKVRRCAKDDQSPRIAVAIVLRVKGACRRGTGIQHGVVIDTKRSGTRAFVCPRVLLRVVSFNGEKVFPFEIFVGWLGETCRIYDHIKKSRFENHIKKETTKNKKTSPFFCMVNMSEFSGRCCFGKTSWLLVDLNFLSFHGEFGELSFNLAIGLWTLQKKSHEEPTMLGCLIDIVL